MDRAYSLLTIKSVDPEKRVITYCGKGDASCTVFLALKMVGLEDVALYDGSLAEWSRNFDLPMSSSTEQV